MNTNSIHTIDRIREIVGAHPTGCKTQDYAAAMQIGHSTALQYLGKAKRAGIVFRVGGSQQARWATEQTLAATEAAHAAAAEAIRRKWVAVQNERRRTAEEKARRQQLEQERFEVGVRILRSASDAPKLRVTAPRSVFELGSA